MSITSGTRHRSWSPCIGKAERRKFRSAVPAKALDTRMVRRVCEELGLDPAQLPGPKSRV